jgi:hypothetical protein
LFKEKNLKNEEYIMTLKNEIIYPVMLECCKYAKENFWINIFEDLSYGKTPYGIYIYKDFLCCNYKSKEFNYKIEVNKDPKILYDEIYYLLFVKFKLLSEDAKIKIKIDFDNLENNLIKSRKNWNSIRKKNIKDLLIEMYVLDMKKKFNLTIKQAKYLLSIIFTGLIFKSITAKDINYVDGKIINIDGIEFDDKNIYLKRDIYNSKNNISPNIIFERKNMFDNWISYIKEIEKLTKF